MATSTKKLAQQIAQLTQKMQETQQREEQKIGRAILDIAQKSQHMRNQLIDLLNSKSHTTAAKILQNQEAADVPNATTAGYVAASQQPLPPAGGTAPVAPLPHVAAGGDDPEGV